MRSAVRARDQPGVSWSIDLDVVGLAGPAQSGSPVWEPLSEFRWQLQPTRSIDDREAGTSGRDRGHGTVSEFDDLTDTVEHTPVVGRDDRGDPASGQHVDGIQHCGGVRRIQLCGRFVSDHESMLGDCRASECQTLPFAARHLRGSQGALFVQSERM